MYRADRSLSLAIGPPALPDGSLNSGITRNANALIAAWPVGGRGWGHLSLKSVIEPVDFVPMRSLFIANSFPIESSIITLTAIVAAMFALLVLKVLASHLEYQTRFNALRAEAHILRERQAERIRNMRPPSKR